MLKLLLLVGCGLVLSGCNGLNRLLGQPDESSPVEEVLVGGGGTILGEIPEFNIPTPEGFNKVVYHGILNVREVAVNPSTQTVVQVFIKDVGQWFVLKPQPSGAFWYSRPSSAIVRYEGTRVVGKEYCIYEYVPL